MISRSIGSVLRGKGTPAQFMMACILGAALGFMPGFKQAPGLIACLTLLLVLLNANLFLAVSVGLLAKLAAFALMPVSFAIGRSALDGPTQGLFKSMINAPVLAFFGFEYYAVTGGLLLGVIVGVIVGLIIIAMVNGFRRKMSGLEENSERYKQWSSKGWVKALLWVFAGSGHGKATYADLLGKKWGNPIRPIGAALVVLAIVLAVIVKTFFSGPLIAVALKGGLETANGATVDVESTDVDLQAGRITITGLAMADPKALDTDLLRAAKVEGQINTSNLLRKRVQLDKVLISGATSGEKRKTPGRLVGTPPEPQPEPATPGKGKTLDEYLKDAKVWKERLSQAKDWLEKLSGKDQQEGTETAQQPGEQQPGRPSPGETPQPVEPLARRIERLVREHGHANVAASHLIEGAPTVVVSELVAEKVRTPQFEGETVDVIAKNLSTHPRLTPGAPEISIKTSGGTMLLDVLLGEAAASPTQNLIKLAYKGLPTDSFAKSLAGDGKSSPLSGGTIDFSTDGRWSNGLLDLPLNVVLNDAMVALGASAPQRVKQLLVPIGVAGTLDQPRVTIDQEKLSKALVDAGINEATVRARAEVDKAKAQATAKVQDEGKKLLNDTLRNALGQPQPGEKKR
jgi:uncharacterized protein (TIGR03546 family)